VSTWNLIAPFLRPIEGLLMDPEVSEVLVNPGPRVFFERDGVLQETAAAGLTEDQLRVAVKHIARVLGDDVSEEQPILAARLPDGSRVAAILGGISVGGLVVAIRKFTANGFTIQDLVARDSMPQAVADLLVARVRERRNILVSGGTSTGKTTLLNILTAYIPDDERIVLIEDTAEIQIAKPNLVRLEGRREHPGLPAVTIRDLLRATLRLRPDRIVVGEIRGVEAYDWLQALNTGHSGSLSTIHANSARQALQRLASCCMQSDVQIPYRAIKSSIADSVELVLQIERSHGHRRVAEIIEIRGYDPETDSYALETLYQRSGGHMHATGRTRLEGDHGSA